MLIDHVNPKLRKRLVIARRDAMNCGISKGTATLHGEIAKANGETFSILAARLLECELNFLDHKFDVAAKVFDEEISPLLQRIDPEIALPISDNRATIGHATFDASGIASFYHEVDIRRILGVELQDWSEVLQADRCARAGKHSEALSLLWRQLRTTYRVQNWRARCWAHGDFARECLALGWPDEAAWHAVQAMNEELIAEVSADLVACRSSERLLSAISRLLEYSHLARHASISARLFATIADFIPDTLVSRVVDWVTARLNLAPKNWPDGSVFEHAWQLVGKIAPRLDATVALRLGRIAAQQAELQVKTVVRQHLIDAWSRLLPRIAQRELPEFVLPAISLVTTLKSDVDYVEAINLVCHLAKISGECRTRIRNELFPAGVPISNPILLEAASYLGWRPQNPETLNAAAVAAAVRNQVQFLRDGEVPHQMSGFGHIEKPVPGGRLVVHIGGAQHWLDAVVSHLDLLRADDVQELTDALSEMISDNRNLISNRIGLLHSLARIAPRLHAETSTGTLYALRQLARGDFAESEVAQSHADAVNLLNPFKMNMGDPRDLRGASLCVIAEASKLHKSWSELLHSGLLADFLEDDDETIRRYGISAARDCDQLSEIEMTALIACVVDMSPKVRTLALHALAQSELMALDARLSSIAIASVTRAAGSPDRDERFAGAKAAHALMERVTEDGRGADRLKRLLACLGDDVSFSVRRIASGKQL